MLLLSRNAFRPWRYQLLHNNYLRLENLVMNVVFTFKKPIIWWEAIAVLLSATNKVHEAVTMGHYIHIAKWTIACSYRGRALKTVLIKADEISHPIAGYPSESWGWIYTWQKCVRQWKIIKLVEGEPLLFLSPCDVQRGASLSSTLAERRIPFRHFCIVDRQ